MSCMLSVLVQQCSSTSNRAVRVIRAAVLNSRFKCSSGACEEIEGVKEISENFQNLFKKIQQSYLMLLGAGLHYK